MTVVRGSHTQGQLPHHLALGLSMWGSRYAAEGEAAEDVALSLGQMSVHHPAVHGSGANVTREDRIGAQLPRAANAAGGRRHRLRHLRRRRDVGLAPHRALGRGRLQAERASERGHSPAEGSCSRE